MSENNFVVTARKWRPQTFSEVVGQEHITTTIKNAIINKRVAHAYLFTGPRGCGKTTTARILAKTLNCLNPVNGEPCNKCEMCESFLNSQTLDIIEIDGASNRRIEEIRTLRESVKYAPTKGNYKVYIIDEVHMLTTESFNGNKVDSNELSAMFNLIDEEVYFDISYSLLEKNFASAFEVTQKIYANGWNFIDFLNGLTEHFRNILTVVIRKDINLIEGAEIFRQKYIIYADKFSEGDLLRILSFINKTSYELKTSSNQKLKLEVALFHLIGLERSSTISDLISKLDKTEFKSSFSSSSVQEIAKPFSAKNASPIKNIEPVLQSEIKIPQVESFVVPQAKTDSDLPNVIEQWKSFVDQVKSEKVFFGSVLFNSSPVNFANDQIHLEVDHPDDEDIIKSNETYLDSKTKEVFGKRLKFNVSKKRSSAKKAASGAETISSKDESSLAQSIINDLGGKEINRL